MSDAQRLRRPASAILVLLLLCLTSGACSGNRGPTAQGTDSDQTTQAAGVHTASATGSSSSHGVSDRDGDGDASEPNEDDLTRGPVSDGDNYSDARPGPAEERRDSDDGPVVAFGHPADARQSAAIAALVRRYYAIAVAEDGAKGCSMLYSIYAESIPEDYGSPSGPSWSQGETCAAVLTKTFQHFHDELAFRALRLHVGQVRVEGRHGVALLRFPGLLERELDLEREGRSWRIFGLIDKPLP